MFPRISSAESVGLTFVYAYSLTHPCRHWHVGVKHWIHRYRVLSGSLASGAAEGNEFGVAAAVERYCDRAESHPVDRLVRQVHTPRG
jgi:hypothetical protein